MNIAVITVDRLKDFPPIITMLKSLVELGHSVTLLSPAKEEYLENINNVKNLYIKETPIDYQERYDKKGKIAGAARKVDSALKKVCLNKLVKKYKKELFKADIVWLAHEETVIAGGKKFVDSLPDYIYTMYELPLKLENNKLYEYAARKAKVLVSPEYFRAHIMSAIYQRDNLPYIIPNKPFEHPRTPKMYIEDDELRNTIEKLESRGKKIIMYMGIMSGERPLEPIIEAVQSLGNDYELVVIGPWSRYGQKMLDKYGDKFTYLGSLKPPKHLQVASHAYITYIVYHSNNKTINAVFCAPNKVYEFAGFGVPMISNDIPGLKYVVKENHMGVCVEKLEKDYLIDGIKSIEKNYSSMSKAANEYYEKENLNEMFEEIINNYN